MICLPFFSLFSLNSFTVSCFSSTFGVAVSSSLALFGAFAVLGLVAFFLAEVSAAGVFGVESLSLVAVFGVFAG